MAVHQEFQSISERVAETFAWLYDTEHYEPAIGLSNPKNPYVAERLKNLSQKAHHYTSLIEGNQERIGELVGREEVEYSLGFPVSNLLYAEHGANVDLAKIDTWICIPATLIYTVWSDVYRCEGLRTIEEPTGQVNLRTGKPIFRKRRVLRGCKGDIIARGAVDKQDDDGNNAFIRCPNCSERWMKGRVQRTQIIPVEVCYEYQGLKMTGDVPRSRLLRATRPVSAQEQERIREIRSRPIPYWYPNFVLNKDGPRYRRDSLAGKLVERYPDFFTYRNLWAIAMLWAEIDKAPPFVRPALRFCLTSQLMRCSRLRRMRGTKPGEQLSGTLHISSETVESNVLRVVRKAVQDYQTALPSACSQSWEQVYIRCGSATDLHPIPNEAVDYIFTDPPFGANIYYYEVNCLWEAWLGAFTDEIQEAVMHRPVDGGYKRLDHYASLMRQAFTEMYRVLKPSRCATVEFNNSDGQVFEIIKQGLISAGFEIENMLIFDKVHRTYAQVRSDAGISEVVDKDVLFNLRKAVVVGTANSTETHDVEYQVVDSVREHLRTLPERIRRDPAKYNEDHRTTATVNSMLMNTLIPKGVNVDRLNLPFIERVCSRYFRKVGQRWYLRGEAVSSEGTSSGLLEAEIVIKDEISAIEWVRQHVKGKPALIGELKPLWMRAIGLLPPEISQALSLGRYAEQ